MPPKNEVKEWWTNTLLHQSSSAHPVFGRDVSVRVEGDVVTLTGQVDDAEEVEQLEEEARGLEYVHHVVNHLQVRPGRGDVYHMQTVIGIFANPEAAELTQREVMSAQLHETSDPKILVRGPEAEHFLRERADAAGIGDKGLKRFLDVLESGKVLLVDRVPEDDALRVISALEGSLALSVETLPPEPDSIEGEQ